VISVEVPFNRLGIFLYLIEKSFVRFFKEISSLFYMRCILSSIMDASYLVGGVIFIVLIAVGIGIMMWYLFKKPKI